MRIALLALALIAWALIAPAQVDHFGPDHWYDASCCSGRDCAPIPMRAVTITPEGYHVRLTSADHPHVPEGVVLERVFRDAEIRLSQDGQYHACVAIFEDYWGNAASTTDGFIRCLYVGGIS